MAKKAAGSSLRQSASVGKRITAKAAKTSAGAALSQRVGTKKSTINPAMIEAPVTKPRNLSTIQADIAVRAYLSSKKK
jgi:hypothetical protein